MNEITVTATIENINTVTEFVDRQLEKLDCPLKTQAQIDIAIDELFSNIAHYAYSPNIGEATVRLETGKNPNSVILTFIDTGKPYNPLQKTDPDITLALDGKEIGGLGIFLVKKSMDEMTYEYTNGQNILRIRKNI